MQKKLLEVQVGMSREQVVKILGTPDLREVVSDKNGVLIDFYFYQTRFLGDAVIFRPKDTDLIPFAFVDDRLIGWGRSLYDRATHHEIDARETFDDKTPGNKDA